jgi:hypothetical protein
MRRFLFALVLVLLAGGVAAQTLPPASWYALIYTPEDDRLHWVRDTGTVYSAPRPRLPDELETDRPRVHLSPDGRSLVVIRTLIDDTTGIGFYDLSAGRFNATHRAQPGEVVALGTGHTTQAGSVVLAFASPATASWRLIVFDYATGSPTAQLRSDDPIAVVAPSAALPEIVEYSQDPVLDQPVIHLRLCPTDETESLAYAWYPQDGVLAPEDPVTPDDVLFSTGERLFTYTNRTFPQPDFGGEAGGNAIGRGDALNPETLYADGSTVKTRARWLAAGQWIGYFAQGEDFAGWQVVPVDAGEVVPQITLAGEVLDLIGTPAGFLALRAGGVITHTVDFAAPDGGIVFQDAETTPQVIAVTPETIAFTLDAVNITAPFDPDEEVVIPSCQGAPPTNLNGVMSATVGGTVPLRVRSAPGGTLLAEMPVGTRVTIIGGPECVNGFLWWAIRWEQSAEEVIEGWSAEAGTGGYYLEAVIPTPTPPLPTVTPTPTLGSGPFVPPTVTPTPAS